MTIAADMRNPLAHLVRIMDRLREIPEAADLALPMGLAIVDLESHRERVEAFEAGPCGQRRPEIHEIESGVVLVLDAWRHRLRQGEVAL